MCALGAPARAPASRRPSQTPRGCAAAAVRPTTDLPSASAKASLRFHCALVFGGTETRAHVRLLGPCFKTGRMESQPSSSQTPARAGEHQAAASDLLRDSTTGNPEGSNRIACLGAAASASPRRDAPRRASTGRRASDKTVGGQTTAHPKGLKQSATRRTRPVPTCPPRQPRRGRDVNRRGSTTPGPHESLLFVPDRSRRPTEGAVRALALAHRRRQTTPGSGNRSRRRPPRAPTPANV
jgi:hypothetical protein